MKDITNYKTPSPSTLENQQLADDLNEFYCRFEKTPFTPATPTSPTPALQKDREKEGTGPDGVTPSCLKTCADQLAPIFTQIFNRSLELCEVPSCFKRSTIIPVPKKPKITGLNDYRPVALTSVVMKSFERLVLAYWRTPHPKTPLSAYKQEIKKLAVWCSLNILELNTLKTVAMIVDFRRKCILHVTGLRKC